MNKLGLGLIVVAIIISYLINTYYVDNLLKIFNIISVITLLINRISLAFFIYLILDLIFKEKKRDINLFMYKISVIYFIWLIGILFGRKEFNYSIYSCFNFRSVIFTWINYLNNKLVVYYLIGNVLIYIPMGLVFRYFKPLLNSFIYCLFLIIILETLQAVTKLGYFDIDDIILNSIGSLFGIIFMEIYKKITVKHI